MPYKKGPNGTLRYYDSSTGKYCNDPNSIFNFKPLVIKKSFQELEKERRQGLVYQAKRSRDKYLFEVYSALEQKCPGCVRHINAKVYDRNIGNTREIDIITTKGIYEIKSGKVKHRFKQFVRQNELANNLKKKYYLYCPDISSHKIALLAKKGIRVYKTIKELIESEVKK